ncbi:MAG: response regulator [Gemmatimonadaceae bacterium]|nr:response regulator [Gemmatimonadaceae bacterium]MCW5826226.1 response regulator [Gemmatimonadaceae bacterium]
MAGSADLNAVLAELREKYLATSGNTLTAFSELAEQLLRDPAAPEVVDALRRELHRVHGTAGSYGFHEASRLAGALEPVAVKWAGDPALDRDRRAGIVRQFVRALAASLKPEGAAEPESAADKAPEHRVLLVEVPDAAGPAIVAEAMHRGYAVEQVTALGVGAVFEATPPTIVIAGAHVPLSVPEGVPLLLLRGPDGQVAPRAAGARLLESSTDAREILLMAESLATRAGLVGVTLLIVDDDEDMIAVLRAMTERQGMFVEARTDARQIAETIEEVQPALVLLDIGLPGVNGLVVTRELKTDDRFRDLPLMLVSGSTDVDTRTAAFVAGADDFQSKPVVAEELLRRIERLLEAARQKQLSRGIHPGTRLPLPQRAVRAFDEALVAAAALAQPMAVAVLRPLDPPDGVQRAALWHRELRLLASALSSERVQAGFRDETAAMFLFPMKAAVALARLEPYAEASRADLVPWSAGVVELLPGADPSALRLAGLAEEAWLAARDNGEYVRRWDPADTGIAPDVIVVEDDAALADLVTFALAARGLTWVRYPNGPAALEGLRTMRVRGRSPIVLMDVDLPGLDGFSLHERLRVERPGVFRVVFISVHASEADQLRAIRAGALDYLAKPVSLRVLMAKITGWRARGTPE